MNVDPLDFVKFNNANVFGVTQVEESEIVNVINGDSCQVWIWFKESYRYFCKIDNFAYGEIDERSFSNPHHWAQIVPVP